MLFHVGCFYNNCFIYDRRTNTKKHAQLGKRWSDVNSILTKLSKVVLLAEIQRVVFVRWRINFPTQFSEKLIAAGVQKVHVINECVVKLQTLVNERRILFIEKEYFLYTWDSYTYLWQHVDKTLVFIQRLSNLKSLRKVVEEQEIQKWLCIQCNDEGIKKIMKQEFHELQIFDQSVCFSDQDLANTTLWMAKRMDGLESGYLAKNMYTIGPEVFFDGRLVLDKMKKGVPLPFEWSSEWGVKAKMVRCRLLDFNEKIELPQNNDLRVSLKIDSDGVPKLGFELPTVIGIWLQFDSLFIVKSNDGEIDKTVSGPFSTNVSFGKNPSEVTDSSSELEIVKNCIEMLDGDLEPKEDWVRCKSKNLAVVSRRELVSASKVVEKLFQNFLKEIKTMGRVRVVLLVSTNFTENQRIGLKQAAKQVYDEVVLLSATEAALCGIARENNLVTGDLLLVVDLSMTGCKCTVVKVESNSKIIHLAQKVDDTLFSENVRQNQRAWFKRTQEDAYPPTDTPELEAEVERLQNSAYIVDSVNEAALNQLLGIIDSVMKNQSFFSVKVILLFGECRMIPLLHNLLYWKFSKARVMSLTSAELRELAARGAAICSGI